MSMTMAAAVVMAGAMEADVEQEGGDESNVAVLTPERDVAVLPQRSEPKRKRQPLYHVVIWNDDTHTYEYVIELLMELFGHPFEKAYQITKEVDTAGKGIAQTTHKELAELKAEQIMSAGADWRMAMSEGPIRATIEPVPQ
jgi:ATP-dependent Clp protease adaptor protein ClpS